MFQRQYSGPIEFDLDDGGQTAQIYSWPSSNNFKVDVSVGNTHWEEENGALNLDLKSLGPAMRYTDLGDEGYEGMMVTGEPFEVKGTLNGEGVSGLGTLDMCWLPPGIGFTQSKTYTHIQDTWMPWITRYNDGSLEHGVIACGPGDWNWGFYSENGKPILSELNTIDRKWDVAGGVRFPVEADIQHGDRTFKWVADGRMNINPGKMNWVSGKVINRDKKATPVETYSWHEFRANASQ